VWVGGGGGQRGRGEEDRRGDLRDLALLWGEVEKKLQYTVPKGRETTLTGGKREMEGGLVRGESWVTVP